MKIKCSKCGSSNVDVEDLGLTSSEHYCSCDDCGNVEQGLFQEVD